MRICFVGKYPPIQGGVSRLNFWASYALAQEGFDVHVVTNAREVEYQFKIFERGRQIDPINNLHAFAKNKLTVHYSSNSKKQAYIPWANPFVTKLATIATDVIETYSCELLYSFYLEPYALAAYLASQWTNIPYGICTAGSDIGRLFQQRDLQTAYRRVIQSADYIFASHNLFRRFLHLGVDIEKLYRLVPDSLPTDYFNPSATPLDINKLLDDIRETLPETNYQGVFHRFASKPFDPLLPTIGIYGKIGQTKGSFDLLRALSKLRSEGVKFNFLALTQGHAQVVLEFVKGIQEYALEEVTWLLPFLPHWDIPNFIRSCVAICFLERNFPIPIHSPTIPREVFACGTCLILSSEVANKWIYSGKLRDSSNVLLIDPINTDELVASLRTVIEDPASSQKIGMNGYREISSLIENFSAYSRNLVTSFTSIQQDIEFRRSIMSIAEMQACLARLYVNDSFRKLFYLEPDTTIKDYKLTEQEIHAIKSIDKKVLDYFANSLITKRGRSFQSAYPLLSKLIGVDFNRYFKRYYSLFPAKSNESSLPQMLSFGEFMEQSLASDEDVPSYASDLARYERFCYSAKFSPWPRDSFKMVNDISVRQPHPVDLTSHPYIQQGIQTATFKYNIIEIVSDLQHQQEPESLQLGEYCLIFQQVANSLTPKIFAISPITKELLSLCDGSHSVSDVVEIMERALGKDFLEDDIVHILRHLNFLQVIGV